MRIAPRRQRVRIHFADQEPSIEGFLMGRANGHYHLALAEIIEGEGRTVVLDNREIAIPRERVFFYEVLR